METGVNILIAVLACVGVLSFITIILLVIRSALASFRKKSKRSPAGKRMETMKMVVWICLANGFAWVWCSYILAFLDKIQIAETLSQAAVTQIIGVVLAYAIKSAIENLSKNNHWPDKPPKDTTSDTASTGDGSTGVG